MDDAWKALVEAGVPSGAARRTAEGSLDFGRIREAVAEIGEEIGSLDTGQQETLYAWLCALRHHWPKRND